MKHAMIMIGTVAAVLLSGCTSTHVKTDTWELKRTSFLQKIEIPAVEIAPDGTTKLAGYTTDGGSEATAAIVNAAVSAAVKAAIP